MTILYNLFRTPQEDSKKMENIKVTDGQWHVKIGKKWHIRSNFIFSILYEVAHPQDSIYVVDVTTDDGQKG